jgi:hypothetical protein
MEMFKHFSTTLQFAVVALVTGVLLASCSAKKSAGSGSNVSLHFPSGAQAANAQAIAGKESASAYDFSRVCYAVNITGTAINNSQASTCDIPVGVFAGFAAPGGDLSIEVPRGVGRHLEIFAYMRKTSAEPCPQGVGAFSTIDRSRVARVGSVASFDTQNELVELQVNVTAPPPGENLITEFSLKDSCAPKTIPSVGGSTITNGNATVSGGAYVIHGTISGEVHEAVLSGGNYLMQISRRAQ